MSEQSTGGSQGAGASGGGARWGGEPAGLPSQTSAQFSPPEPGASTPQVWVGSTWDAPSGDVALAPSGGVRAEAVPGQVVPGYPAPGYPAPGYPPSDYRSPGYPVPAAPSATPGQLSGPPYGPPTYGPPTYGQPRYGQPSGQAYGQAPAPVYGQAYQVYTGASTQKNSLGTNAVALGVVSFFFCPWLASIGAIITGALGIAAVSRGEASNRGMAVAGLVLGIASLLIYSYVAVAWWR